LAIAAGPRSCPDTKAGFPHGDWQLRRDQGRALITKAAFRTVIGSYGATKRALIQERAFRTVIGNYGRAKVVPTQSGLSAR